MELIYNSLLALCQSFNGNVHSKHVRARDSLNVYRISCYGFLITSILSSSLLCFILYDLLFHRWTNLTILMLHSFRAIFFSHFFLLLIFCVGKSHFARAHSIKSHTSRIWSYLFPSKKTSYLVESIEVITANVFEHGPDVWHRLNFHFGIDFKLPLSRVSFLCDFFLWFRAFFT